MDQVVNGLRTLGLAPISSEANFFYFDVGAMAVTYSTRCCVRRHRPSYRRAHDTGDDRQAEENRPFLAALAGLTGSLNQGEDVMIIVLKPEASERKSIHRRSAPGTGVEIAALDRTGTNDHRGHRR